MEFFINSTAQPAANGTYLRGTPSYVELQRHSRDPAGVSHIYVIPVSDVDFLVVACLKALLDHWVPLLTDPRMGTEYMRFMQSNHPVTGRYLMNGLEGRYSDGALLNVADPDLGDRVWIFASLVGNLDVTAFQGFEDLLADRRFMQAYETVLGGAFSMCAEVASGKRPSASSAARLFFGSVRRDTVDLGRITFENLPKIIEVAKALAG